MFCRLLPKSENCDFEKVKGRTKFLRSSSVMVDNVYAIASYRAEFNALALPMQKLKLIQWYMHKLRERLKIVTDSMQTATSVIWWQAQCTISKFI